MLKKNQIPASEPTIRVGIVLPEDNKVHIDVLIPDNIQYTINSENISGEKVTQTCLHFTLKKNTIHLGSRPKAKTWIIQPESDQKIEPGSGLMIKDVISGRGFHWQKKINVHLPGKIEIKAKGNSLILINELSLEQYIICVTTSEMSGNCPASFIEAQTIAARSWLLANVEQKHKSLTIDVCNDDCCQRYHGSGQLSYSSLTAAQKTSGKILMYENKICDARYSKNCGGITENYSTIWGDRNIKYLSSIYDAPANDRLTPSIFRSEKEIIKWIDSIPTCFCSSKIVPGVTLQKYLGTVDTVDSYFRWQKKLSQAELTGIITNKLSIRAKVIRSLIPLKRGESGRISKLRITYIDHNDQQSEIVLESEYKIRDSLDKKFLYSSCFYVLTNPESVKIPEEFIIKGAGWGHGVGMCQTGALGMALQGYSYEEILKH